ncbi:acyltransferase [Clavibacter lycopersici]|uniref:Acyltransferase n=1 Tax=Clavibacter lycopersici TaxID=2301718 RepID=A0A399SWW0_9MICO|nr:acyltransferase [Clavibacter lycopersici]RIJ46517.1 acyltransferase [Clavibacter lycopersici]RIJ59088.1 acyltransferase [Clavibacter lycopersici]
MSVDSALLRTPLVRPRPDLDAALARPSLPSLTGLRWVAAFVVFAYHVRNTGYFSGHAQDAMSAVFGAGATGVSLFFLLSGFVLAWSDRPGRGIVSFWRHRLARIYPVHLVTLVAALLLAAGTLPAIRTGDPHAVVADALLVSSWKADWWQAGNPVSWSLTCEAFFYLVFPLVIPLLRRARADLLIAAAVLLATVVVVGPVISAAEGLPVFWYAFPLTRLPEFLLGVVLALLLRSGAWRGARLVPAIVLALVGYAAAAAWPGSPFGTAGFTIVGFALLVTALARADVAGRRTVLATRPLVALGVLSFPFYMAHLLVVQTIAAGFGGSMPPLPAWQAAILTACALVLALFAALVLHHAVEVPGRRLVLGVRR